MKNIITSLTLLFILSLPCLLHAQGKVITPSANKSSDFVWEEEASYRKQMKANGLSDAMIDKLVQANKNIRQNGTLDNNHPILFGSCKDMGVEGGWGEWKAEIGENKSGVFSFNGGPADPSSFIDRFEVTTGGIDDCTPGILPGSPTIPKVAPGFGKSSIRIGQRRMPGNGACAPNAMAGGWGCVERLTFPLTVTDKDTNFIYAYAIVVENPIDNNHSLKDHSPFAEIKILDGNTEIKCGYQRYQGDPTGQGKLLPGFSATDCPNLTTNLQKHMYKPWTIVGVNLKNYVNKTLTVQITNSDCALGGHFCHSYWDFVCPPQNTTSVPFCLGSATTLIGPDSDPANPYTYEWFKDKKRWPGPNSANTQSITPTPKVGEVYSVYVKQSSGCNFWFPFTPEPMTNQANFTFTSSCGSDIVNFQDSAFNLPGVTPTSWEWTFEKGTPATHNGKNPPGIKFPFGGPYTATLVITTSAGCKATVVKKVSVGESAKALFSSDPVCAGLPTKFTNQSQIIPGDPVKTYDWKFPGSDTPTSDKENPPTVIYPAGTYTATLTIITQLGCTSTVQHPVVVNPLPIAKPLGENVCFNQDATKFQDLSTANNTMKNWQWDFGDGNKDVVQNPSHTYSNPGTYTVTLFVENNFGCKDTNVTKVIVHPMPVPDFVSLPVCAGDTTCFTDKSMVTPGNITGWNWNFGDPNSGTNNISNQQNPCHIYNGNGPYSVLLTVTTDSGCSLSKTLPASTLPPPLPMFTVPNACFNINNATLFTNLSKPATGTNDPIGGYEWFFGDGTTSNAQNPSHIYTKPGTYTATLVVTSQAGCVDTTFKPVTLYHIPVALYNDSAKGCAPVCASFKDLSTSLDGGIVKWTWSFPGGNPSSSTSSAPSICWTEPGTYDVQLIVESAFGCIDTAATPKYINVFSWPTADFSVAPSVAPTTAPNFLFTDFSTVNVANWVWNFGDGVIDSTKTKTNPIHSYSATATENDFYHYNICLDVQTIHGCYHSVCRPVDLLPEFTFYIPNTFTPNGSGPNENFFGKSRGVKEYQIWVFDRWGNLIWDCNIKGKNTDWDKEHQDGMSSACKWDGIVEKGAGTADMNGRSGQLVQEDVYVWKVKLTDIFDKKHSYVGHVNQVR